MDFDVSEFIETIIVGGGQAGPAISYYLKQEGREHLVLERAPVITELDLKGSGISTVL